MTRTPVMGQPREFRHRPLAWLLLLLAASLPAAAAERDWRTLATANYRVISQLSDRETTAWAREFDQFIASISGMLRIDSHRLPRLTVVLFGRDREFTPYKMLRPDGKAANVDGQFARQATWSSMAMTRKYDDVSTRQLVFHEATHWLMSADEARQPAWFSEGIAELLSTFEYKGDRINWAKPLESSLAILRLRDAAPLREFLTQANAISSRDAHTELFYAQSWGFMHFLLFSGDGSRAALLSNFLDTYRLKSGEAAMAEVFGPRLDELEKQFKDYVEQSEWHYSSLPQTAVAPPAALQPAPPALVETALGFVALGAGRNDLARAHAQKAIELDATAPGGHEVLAHLARSANNPEEAALHAQNALQRGTRDSDMHVLRGQVLQRTRTGGRELADLYGNAIDVNPQRALLYSLLTGAVLNLEQSTADDAKRLRQGMSAFPGDDWIRVGVAVTQRHLDQRSESFEALQRALRSDSTLEASRRDAAQRMRRNWHMEDLGREVEAAMNKRDVAAARAAIDRHRAGAEGDERAQQYVQRTEQQITQTELLDRLSQAQRAGRMSEARSIADQLLALPDLPPQLRDQIRRSLGGSQR